MLHMRSMLKHNRVGVTIILCIVLFACIGGAYHWNDKQLQKLVDIEQTAALISKEVNKLRALIDLSGGTYLDTRVVLQGNLSVSGMQWEQERRKWMKATGIDVSLQAVQERGRQVYKANYKLTGGDVHLIYFEEEDHRSYYVITVTGQEEAGMKHAIAEMTQLYLSLAKAGYTPKWNAALKTRVYMDRIQTWDKVQSVLTELGQADALDYYEDDRSISVSYTTSYMKNEMVMQGKNVNLQAAVHENEEKGFTQITFGSPLIDGEY